MSTKTTDNSVKGSAHQPSASSATTTASSTKSAFHDVSIWQHKILDRVREAAGCTAPPEENGRASKETSSREDGGGRAA
eukprot:scaffold154_cov185-Alexandrium_tamarense.AAC.1